MTVTTDDTPSSASAKLVHFKLAAEFAKLKKERDTIREQTDTASRMRLLKIGVRIREIVIEMGKRPKPAPQPAPAPEVPAAPAQKLVGTEPHDTQRFYPEEGKRTKGQRQKDNDAAIALLAKIKAGEVAVTDDEREVLAKYSGNGGGLVDANGMTGSPYEYYTPKAVAGAAWSLLEELGFKGGTVLDPSAGSGVFAATRPTSAVMTQIELDETSGSINAAINDGPTSSTTISPFEAVAAATPDEMYDAIVTNVPFGDLAMRGDNPLKDSRFQKANLQEYFVLRSLQKLKPNGLAAFIVPKSIVSGLSGKEVKLRQSASLMAEFVGAYRLPNSIFTTAAADVTTDLIVFRKFSREAALKIEELQQQNPAVLSEANVLWDEFLSGKYFAGEGRKYILGEEGTTKGKYGEVAAVINDDTIANIVKMIKRFPASHINWQLLEQTETAPIVYEDGDVIHANGQTLEFKDGGWVALASNGAESKSMTDLGQKVQTPLDCVNNGITWAQAHQWMEYQGMKGRHLSIPAWLNAVGKALDAVSVSEVPSWWEAICAGLAVMGLMQESSSVEPYNYREGYPVLSAQLARVQAYGNKTLGRASKLVRDGLLSIRNARVKGEFTPFWLGEIRAAQEAVSLTPSQLYEKVKYEAEDETRYVPVEKLQATFSGFDPLESDEWCVSADGKAVMHANDYYTGSYADFLRNAEGELAQCDDPAVRAKLVRQHDAAKSRLATVDVSTMQFSLFTPHITMLQKLEFLRAYVSPDIFLSTDVDGREVFDIKQKKPGTYAKEEEIAQYKAMQRFVKGYLKNQNITTQNKQVDVEADPDKEAALIRRIKDIADKAKAQFDAWARANDEIQVGLNNRLNSPEALRFIEEPDGSPVEIPNLNVIDFRPHSYQFAAVRRFARNFGGVLGFDVGLGKTLTALAATQYCQSIGVKRKTIFVVPNATLTNWKKESGKAYLDTSDCLYVGLVAGKNGKDKIDGAQVKADLNAIRENRHSKIFMTLEAFKMIPLRDETMEAYISYLSENDDAYLLSEDDASKKKASIAADSKTKQVRDLGEKSGALPYFEDMGVDSLVLDEAHNYKNSKMTSSQFKGAKYLADPAKSQRGMDMQAKAWFIRNLTPRNDGVLSLTATPITNSPLEMYAMLTLALGEREVNAMYGVTGADSFMAAACSIEEREEENIVGIMRPVRVFDGLQNVSLLRRLLQSSVVIKTAEDVKADGLNIVVPDSDEIDTSVDIGADAYSQIIGFKDEYLEAVEVVRAGGGTPEEKLAASPFNLIRKMTRVINDPELHAGIIKFKFSAAQADAAAKAIKAFNAKNVVEERDYPDENADPADIKTRVVKDTETGESVTKYLVTVRARAAATGRAVELLSTDYETQDVLLKIMATNGVSPTVTISPKLAAVIENFRAEAASPRWMGQAKQIIFCDELGLHHKIKLALTQAVGIPASKIKIVNAVAVDTAGMQEVQDGFNADGEDNKYSVIIANKKAEVGINLQKGTQAIHHMTIGWTPDSIHQRNGRGVRQGNPLARVNVYHYDADGTFDGYKRKLVGIKADWIGSLMSGDEATIKIEGDLSKEDYEMMANAVGDADAMSRLSDEIALRNKRQKRAAVKVAQLQSLRIIEAQTKWLEKFAATENYKQKIGFAAWVNSKLAVAKQTSIAISNARERLDATEGPILAERLRKQIAELQAKRTEQLSMLGGLPVDPFGMPVTPYEGGAFSEADKLTAAYQNWQKDVNIANRMKEEAAVSFAVRADEGYGKSDLEAFNSGNAEIVNGTLAVVGTFVEHEGKLMVVRKPVNGAKSLVGFNPADLTDTELLRMTGAQFIGRDMEEWGRTVQRAVAADERAISLSAGFSPGTLELYSSLVAEVRDALSVPIPAQAMALDSILLTPPYFLFVLPQGASGGALVDKIKAEQAPLIEAYTSNGRSVKLRDLRVIARSGYFQGELKAAAIKQYAIAHKMRATQADLQAIDAYYLTVNKVLDSLGLIKEFFNALPEGVASVKTPEELDAWALGWFNSKQEFMQVDTLETALLHSFAQYRKWSNRIDDGTERWIELESGSKYTLAAPWVAALGDAVTNGLIADQVLAYANAYYPPSDFMVQNENGKKLAGVLFAEADGRVELKVAVTEARASMNVPASARLYVSSWDAAVALVESTLSSRWADMKGWARAYRAANRIDTEGIDLDGMLKALRALDGVTSAEVGTMDDMKTTDRYSASFMYKANEYVLLKTVRGSKTHEKIATAGAAGLQGRTFDNVSKAFRLTIKEGEKFSDGKPVASIASLFEHLNLSIKDYIV
jgi:predicted RNA methylase